MIDSLIKNVSGQSVTFTLINATSGAADTSAGVAVFITIDNAAQITGGGAVSNKGHGQYTYSPLQSETNGTDVGFLFTSLGDIPVNIDFHTDVPKPTSISINPNQGAQSQTISVTISGTLFDSHTTFSLGTGITFSSTVIVSSIQATATVSISSTATLGLRTLTTTNLSGSTTLSNAFTVLLSVFQFPQSGADPNSMAVLGINTSQALLYDYGNTEQFYVLLRTLGPPSPITLVGQLFQVSPLFARNWYGTQSPTVVFDPFNYNQTKPSNR